MSSLNRRTLFRLLGQGTAALGLGFSKTSWATEGRQEPPQESGGEQQKPQAQQKLWDDLLDCDAWEVNYPGVYDDPEIAKGLRELNAKLAQINNRGDINVKDLISGKLDGTPGVVKRVDRGLSGLKDERAGTTITPERMKSAADAYGENNPLFTDKNYAKNTKYGDLIAFPFIVEPGGWPEVPSGLGDYKLISDLNVSYAFHKPIHEGDALFTVLDRQDCVDITPAAGSYYRTYAISGTGRAFNQKGELVAEGSHMVKETYRRHKDPAKRFTGGVSRWESPEWWFFRPPHQYTDKDWEEILKIWKDEKIRGAEVLYWDDVKVGDEPTPRGVGPIVSDVQTDILMSSKLSTDQKQNVLDPKIFATMKKNKRGVYVLPQYVEKRPAEGPSTTQVGGVPELAHRDGRAVVQNSVCAKWAAGMLFNWMGDQGWLQRFAWDIMAAPAGYPSYVIPPFSQRPALYDKFPYMEKVPYLKGKRADCHGMEGDFIIARAYVFDKYQKDKEHFVDLTWWCETLDKYIVEEGFATVKLPKKA
jgi:acyl dehydratase